MYYLRALEAAGPDEVKYVFPVEIDLESIRNRGGAKGFGDNVLEDFNKAISYFEKASQFDKTYATSVLNKSCIYAILKDYRNAKYWAEEALTLAQKENKTSVINNSKLVLALVHYEDPLGDKALSSRLMDELVAVNHDFAVINKQIIDGKEPSEIVFTKPLGWMGDDEASVGSTGIAASEKIEGIRDYANATYNFTQEIRFANNSTMQAGTRDQSVVLMVPFKMSTMIFHYTSSDYAGQMSKGLKVGATGKQLQDAYGAPNVIMPSRQGWIYLYSKNKMMVFVDQNKVINKWVVYSEL
jgi:tetratricopeptide (TPR) repeat protein